LVRDPLLRVISGPTTGLLVFAFPAAGSGPSIFRRWLPHRPPGLELVAIHTPGREDRCIEPPVSSVTPLADDIAAAIDRYGERPYVIFGHSAGALLGREVAWRLKQRARPLRLFVAAGAAAPDVVVDGSLAEADDATLIGALRDWGGIPDAMLSDDVLEVILPCLRADVAVADSCRRDYPPTAEDRLDIPIIALAGADDPAIHWPDCQRWLAWTDAPSVAHLVPGGHFFPFEQPAAVLDYLERDPERLGEPTTAQMY
jgi:surfactin synthase thioesterase subunit